MATKPPDNLPEWADGSNGGNYTGGPFAGSPRKVSIPNGIAAEGYRPGKNDPSTAEHLNDYTNKLSKFIRWVYAGSSTGAADAHILECNDDGYSSVQSFEIRGAADGGQDALRVDGPTSSYGAWVRGHVDSTLAAVRVTHAGDAIGLDVTSNSSSQPALSAGVTQLTGDTVRPALVATSQADLSATITAINTATNGGGMAGTGKGTEPGTQGYCNGSGPGVKGISDTGPGVLGLANATSPGVNGTSSTSQPAVTGRNTSTGPGVRGEGATGVFGKANSDTGYGAQVESTATATSGAALRAAGFADADGVAVVTVNGHGLAVIAGAGDGANLISSSGRAAFFNGNGTKCTTVHNPESADPSSPEDGGMWYRNNVGLKVRREGFTRTLYDTAGGMAFATSGAPAAGSVNGATVIMTATFAGANIPSTVGTVIIEVVVEVGRVAGTPNCLVDIRDDGTGLAIGGVDGAVAGAGEAWLYHAAAAGAYEKTLVFRMSYTLPAAGARTFSVALATTSPGDNIRYRNATLTVNGVF